MVESDTPWTEDSDYGVVDGLIYDAVAQGLTEADPTTTNWEESKRLLGTGEVATMVLGSWAIPQMAAAAEAAGAERRRHRLRTDAGPGRRQVPLRRRRRLQPRHQRELEEQGDRARVDRLVQPRVRASRSRRPACRRSSTAPSRRPWRASSSEVELITLNPAPEGKEALFADIDTASGIVTTDPKFRQKNIDDARSGARTKQQIFDDLNAQWAEGRASAG